MGKRAGLCVSLVLACLLAAPVAVGADPGTDFDGDGRDDVFWYAPGSAPDYVWHGQKSGFSSRPVTVNGDYRPVAGDFDGNGMDDVLWYAPGPAPDYVWHGQKSGFSSRPVTVNGDYRPVAGDFDGNGRDDILWYAPGAGADYVWSSTKSGFSSRAVTINGDYRPVAGDFDNNGMDDILWYAPGSAPDYVWYAKTSGFGSYPVSVSGDYRPVAGDFDGNGYDDILWYAPGPAADYVWTGRKSGFGSYPVSVSGDYRPVAGDFDGNGYDDILWYAPGSAPDYVWNGSPSGFSSRAVSINGDYQPIGDLWWEPKARAAPTPTRSTANPMRSLPPRQVALTFDDGPSPYTPQVLDILDRAGVPATFFVVGDRVHSGAAILRRAHSAGHSIQGHTWNHADLTRLSDAAVASTMTRTADAVQAVTGERPTCFRPPYGALNSRVVSAAAAAGARPAVLWNAETSDYARPSPWTIAQRAFAHADGRGLIVLMHDGGGPRANTVAALPTIINEFKRRGYQFVTLCD